MSVFFHPHSVFEAHPGCGMSAPRSCLCQNNVPSCGRTSLVCRLVSRWVCAQAFVRVGVPRLWLGRRAQPPAPADTSALSVRRCPGASARPAALWASPPAVCEGPGSPASSPASGSLLPCAATLTGVRVSPGRPRSRDPTPSATGGGSGPCPLPAGTPAVGWPAPGPPARSRLVSVCLALLNQRAPRCSNKARFGLWSHHGGQGDRIWGLAPRGSAELHYTADANPGVRSEPQTFSADER